MLHCYNRCSNFPPSASIHTLALFTTERVTWWRVSRSLKRVAAATMRRKKSSRVPPCVPKQDLSCTAHTWKSRRVEVQWSRWPTLHSPHGQPSDQQISDSGTAPRVDWYVTVLRHAGSMYIRARVHTRTASNRSYSLCSKNPASIAPVSRPSKKNGSIS
jgi:hypothetical protein